MARSMILNQVDCTLHLGSMPSLGLSLVFVAGCALQASSEGEQSERPVDSSQSSRDGGTSARLVQ